VAVLGVLVEHDWGVGCTAPEVAQALSGDRVPANETVAEVVVCMLLVDLWRWGLVELAGSTISQRSGIHHYRITRDGRIALI
jgi:hypothetical protein